MINKIFVRNTQHLEIIVSCLRVEIYNQTYNNTTLTIFSFSGNSGNTFVVYTHFQVAKSDDVRQRPLVLGQLRVHSPSSLKREMEVIFFEFLTHFSNRESDWST